MLSLFFSVLGEILSLLKCANNTDGIWVKEKLNFLKNMAVRNALFFVGKYIITQPVQTLATRAFTRKGGASCQ